MQKVTLFLPISLVVVMIFVGQTDSDPIYPKSVDKPLKLQKSDLDKMKRVAFFIDGATAVKYADANGDGLLSLQEASDFLQKYLFITVSAQGLEEFDLNKDGFISAEEIDIEKRKT